MTTDPTAPVAGETAVRLVDLRDHLTLTDAPANAPAALHAVTQHWCQVQAEAGLPMRAHFRPENMVGMLQDLFIIEFVSPGLVRYRLVGTRLAANFPSDPTTQLVGHLESGWGDTVFQALTMRIAETVRPHLILAYAPHTVSDSPVAAAVGLPLYDTGGRLNMMLGSAAFGSMAVMQDTLPDRVVMAELLP